MTNNNPYKILGRKLSRKKKKAKQGNLRQSFIDGISLSKVTS